MSEIPYQYLPDEGLFQIGDARSGVWEVSSFHGMVQVAFGPDGGIAAISIAADDAGDARTRAVLNSPTKPST